MNGALSIAQTLVACGVDTCFANPGTSEMHLVAAFDEVPQVRSVLGLTESVVTGAADGYARLAGKPAATLLHCGPGLANGVANLHNARRARTPLVNLIGDQATHHTPLDPPLAFEIDNLARTVSGWTRVSRSSRDVARDVAAAVAAANDGQQIASLVLPSDVCWDGEALPAPARVPAVRPAPSPEQLAAAQALLKAGPASLLLGTRALHGEALQLAGRIARRTGARLMAPSANARIERGPGRPPVERIPYAIEAARALLATAGGLVQVGAALPVPFFAYPGKDAHVLPPGTPVVSLASPEDDIVTALKELAVLVGALADGVPPPRPLPQGLPNGAIDAPALAQSIAMLLPANAVIVDESVSFGREIYGRTAGAAPHDWLQLTGGAIGDGLPLSTGAALAAPDRRVVTLQADGSALYSVQALWTQARLGLDVTTIILSNRRYATLFAEMRNVGATPGRTAHELFDLNHPAIGWPALATSMGVEAAVARTMPEFNDLFRHAHGRRGPMLIELCIGT